MISTSYSYLSYAIVLITAAAFFSCKSQKNDMKAPLYKTDMLQLDLADKMDPKRIVASFPSLGLEYICSLNEENNIAVYTIDLSKTNLTKAIKFLDKEVGVESAALTLGCGVRE